MSSYISHAATRGYMTKIIIAGIVAVSLCAAAAAGAPLKFPADGISRITTDIDMGTMRITGASVNEVSIEITDNDPARCAMTAKVQNGALNIKSESIQAQPSKTWSNLFGLFSSGKNGKNCKIAFNVTAPSALPLDLHSAMGANTVASFSSNVQVHASMGSIAVSALTGDLVDLRDDMGEISGSACAKELKVKSSMGGVNLTGLCGRADVDSSMGEVKMEWARVPAAGEAAINASMGAIRLTFPPDAKLDVSFPSGMMSKVTNEFDEHAGAFKVHGKAGMGSVSILKATKN